MEAGSAEANQAKKLIDTTYDEAAYNIHCSKCFQKDGSVISLDQRKSVSTTFQQIKGNSNSRLILGFDPQEALTKERIDKKFKEIEDLLKVHPHYQKHRISTKLKDARDELKRGLSRQSRSPQRRVITPPLSASDALMTQAVPNRPEQQRRPFL